MAKWLVLKKETMNNDILLHLPQHKQTVQAKIVQIIVLYLLLVQITM